MLKMWVAFLILFSFRPSYGSQQIKLAVLVPVGTSWGNSLKKLSQEVETVTNGEVSFKIYFGGVSGDEPDVLRKMRIGQLHGGIFTGKSLGEIHGDIRVMEIPFTFYDDQAKASKILKKLTPQFNAGLKGKGYINLGFYEIGKVYLVSTKKITNLAELKGIKIWSWEGDELVKAMIESMELVSVPLALPDVLSSLSTGIINAAYGPPLAILALQWHTKVKYLVDFPNAFSVGALLVSDKIWSKIKPDHQQKILSISQKYVDEANAASMTENEAARTQMKKMGIEFIQFPADDYKKAASVRGLVVDKIKDKIVSSKIIQEVAKEVK
jgi:TRAP-type transport system periplasmic protein